MRENGNIRQKKCGTKVLNLVTPRTEASQRKIEEEDKDDV